MVINIREVAGSIDDTFLTELHSTSEDIGMSDLQFRVSTSIAGSQGLRSVRIRK
jgi:hypothetical protein